MLKDWSAFLLIQNKTRMATLSISVQYYRSSSQCNKSREKKNKSVYIADNMILYKKN